MNNTSIILSTFVAATSFAGVVITVVKAFRIAKRDTEEKIRLKKERHYFASVN